MNTLYVKKKKKELSLVLFLYIGVQILPPSVKTNDVHAKHKMCCRSDVRKKKTSQITKDYLQYYSLEL